MTEERYEVRVRNVGRRADWAVDIQAAPYAEKLARDIAAGLRDRGWDAIARVERRVTEDLP